MVGGAGMDNTLIIVLGLTGLLAMEGGDGSLPGVEPIEGGDLFPPPQPTKSSERTRKRERKT